MDDIWFGAGFGLDMVGLLEFNAFLTLSSPWVLTSLKTMDMLKFNAFLTLSSSMEVLKFNVFLTLSFLKFNVVRDDGNT